MCTAIPQHWHMQQYTDASLADERREEKQHRATKRQRDETQPKIRGNIGGIYAEILKVEERVRAGVVPADELDEPRRGWLAKEEGKGIVNMRESDEATASTTQDLDCIIDYPTHPNVVRCTTGKRGRDSESVL